MSCDAVPIPACPPLPSRTDRQDAKHRGLGALGLVVKLQPRIFAVGHRLATDGQLTGEQIDAILAADGYADVEQVGGSVVSADDIATGCALARERGLETWPDKTAYLQKLDDWSRASYPVDLSPL